MWKFNFQVRCWEVQSSGQTIPKAQQTHTGAVLDADWSDVNYLFYLSIYCSIKCWRGKKLNVMNFVLNIRIPKFCTWFLEVFRLNQFFEAYGVLLWYY